VRGTPLVIPFVKATACGNDFLLIDSSELDRSPGFVDLSALTRRMCDRHDGVGADGVEWMSAHATADVALRLVNSDGSEAEISGNGTRCVAAHVCAEQGKEEIAILTGAGVKMCVLTARRESEYEFEIAMGAAEVGKEFAVKIAGREVRGVPVSMGNPHFVVLVSEFQADWRAQAAEIQRGSQFKQGINVEMVVIEGKHDVTTRFFERGVGETRSSGTGSCAAAVAAIATDRAEPPVRVHGPGGTQTVRVEGHQVFLRGPARLVCRGEFYL
jgi:diaminopimelate epimerase